MISLMFVVATVSGLVSAADAWTAPAGTLPVWIAPCGKDDYVSWRPSAGCPAPGQRCLSVDAFSAEDDQLLGVTLPVCNWNDVEFRITRSNTILSCGGQTLDATLKLEGVGVRITSPDEFALLRDPVACDQVATAGPMCDSLDEGVLEPEHGLHDVTVTGCTVLGYDNAISVEHRTRFRSVHDLRTSEFLAWYEHPSEALCRNEQIEDCLRSVAPHDIVITDVRADGQSGVGIYVNAYSHEVEISRSVITGTRKGPGVYLDSGSRGNVVRGNVITGNGREGIAIDASSDNLIEGNHIEGNGTRGILDQNQYEVGIGIYKNFWENRWRENPHAPRVQRSERNVIEDNDIIDHSTGVAVGMRQEWTRDASYGTEEAWGDPTYYQEGDDRYHRERAADNLIRRNRFDDHGYGILVRDDATQIINNTFTRSYHNDVFVGSKIRQWAREPVHGTLIAGNVFSTPLFPGFAAVKVAWCSLDTSILANAGGPIVTDPCSLNRARVQAINATSTGHTVGFGNRMAANETGQSWLVGDFDADGRDDVVVAAFSTDDRLRLWRHRTGASDFEYQSGFQTMELSSTIPRDGQWIAGNFDGVGGDDLAYVYRSWLYAGVCVFTPLGDGFVRQPGCTTVSYTVYQPSQRWLAADFDGDGRDDLLQVYNSGTTAYVQGHRAVYTPLNGWFSPTASFTFSYGAWRAEDQYLAGDFDRNQRDDIVRIWRGPDDRAQLWAFYLGPNGTVGSRNQDFSTTPGANDGAGFGGGRRWIASDFDGDGRKDIVLVYNRAGDARVWRHRSTGSAFTFTGIQTVESFADSQRWLSGSLGGDLRDDLVRVSSQPWY